MNSNSKNTQGFTRTRSNFVDPNKFLLMLKFERVNKGNLFGNGFTLVEIMISLSVITVLTALLLLVINPIEMTKRSRDNQRLKDISILNGLVDQLFNDNKITTDLSIISASSTSCSSSWIGGLNICVYISETPIDPRKNESIKLANGSSSTAGYRLIVVNREYVLCAPIESTLTKGGEAWIKTGSNIAITCPPT